MADTKEEKNKKKQARKSLLALLALLRQQCGSFQSLSQWYDFLKQNLDPVLSEYSSVLPDSFKGEVKKVKNLTDTSKEGINSACHLLQGSIDKLIKYLPHPGSSLTLVIGAILTIVLGTGALVAYLNTLSVKIILKNRGCDTIQTFAYIPPLSLPIIDMPHEPIPSGGQGIFKLPPLTFTVDGTISNSLTLSSFGAKFAFDLKSSNINIEFDGKSLLGQKTTLDLASRPTHDLDIICK